MQSALLLCAVQYQVASRVVKDAGVSPEPFESTGRMTQAFVQSEKQVLVRASQLYWSASQDKVILETALAFITRLPNDLVDKVLAWAPTVILSQEYPRVVSHAVSAFLANYYMPQERVRCWLPTKKHLPDRSFVEACQLIAYGLKPVIEQHKKHIVRYSPSLEVAPLLSGYSRAWCARIRSDG